METLRSRHSRSSLTPVPFARLARSQPSSHLIVLVQSSRSSSLWAAATVFLSRALLSCISFCNAHLPRSLLASCAYRQSWSFPRLSKSRFSPWRRHVTPSLCILSVSFCSPCRPCTLALRLPRPCRSPFLFAHDTSLPLTCLRGVPFLTCVLRVPSLVMPAHVIARHCPWRNVPRSCAQSALGEGCTKSVW